MGDNTDPCGHLRGGKNAEDAYWAHEYSGPMKVMGGRGWCTKAHWARQSDISLSCYIGNNFS